VSATETLERYRRYLEPAAFEALREAVAGEPRPALRINTLKTTVAEATATWPGRYGWEIQAVPFCEVGWRIASGGEDLARTAEFKMGRYTIQEEASMLPPELFQMEGVLLVLDMAAAPGGKSSHLASRMGDRGLLVANDVKAGRMAALRTRLQDWGATNTVISQSPGESWGPAASELFDRVLLDAPCSGEGLLTAERRRTRPVSSRLRQELQAQQIELLISGFQALAVGGELVYSTCSLHPDENEAVLEVLLARYPRAVTIRAVDHVVAAPALVQDGERRFHPEVGRAVRLWPHLLGTTGFLAALIEKTERVPVERQPYPARSLPERGYRPLAAADEQRALGWFQDTYGFDLEATLAARGLALWRRDEQIHALPDYAKDRWERMPFVAAGMLMAMEERGELIVSHECASRFAADFQANRLTVGVEEGERWLRGQELRGIETGEIARGAVVLVEDEWGRFLGRGKVIGRRVRNLLPRRLVY
jgi:16S rRNA (cytosine1407-C5)-methyltransferase